jgi:hypothetical protein
MYDILILIEFLNFIGKPDYFNNENVYKLFSLSNDEHIKLEIDYKGGLHVNHIINLNDLNFYIRKKKLNKIVSNI